MDLFEQMEWVNWKQLTDQEKLIVFEKAMMLYTDMKIEIVYMALVDFELYGIKCRTIEVEMAGELFVFIPGNKEAILGWDSGAEGLRPHELLGFNEGAGTNSTFKTVLTREEMEQLFRLIEQDTANHFSSLEEISLYINQATSDLRKVKIPPMMVQKYALPAGTEFLGIFDMVSGNFEGEEELLFPYEKTIKEVLYPPLVAENCLSWSFPDSVLKRNQFYLEFLPESDHYFVYSHYECTLKQLQDKVKQQGFCLLNPDQWEFMAGAGTRRLFRWGNELLIQKNEAGKNSQEKINGANMFGVVIDTTKKRYELTNQLEQPKLEKQLQEDQHLIEKMLPLASYYQTTHRIAKNQVLSPEDYLYRKAILFLA